MTKEEQAMLKGLIDGTEITPLRIIICISASSLLAYALILLQ